MTEEKATPVLTDDIDSMLEKPFVDASAEAVAACKEERDFTSLAHGLYREAGCVIFVCASAVGPTGKLPRNQAICAGLLVRIGKFMTAIAQLTFQEDRREVVTALSRCICESATNLRYLILKNDDALYSAFVQSGLGPQREVFDKVNANIAARGGTRLPIEERLLEMTANLCALSGLKIEDVPAAGRDWGGNMRQKIDALGLPPQAYGALQRYGSHAVHGTWTDLLVHHLRSSSEPPATPAEFSVHGDFMATDERDFGPVASYVLDAARDYLVHFFKTTTADPLHARIDDLQVRINRVGEADEFNVQKRRGQEAKS